MKRFLLAVLAVAVFVALPAMVRAEGARSIVEKFHGAYTLARDCEGEGCVGDLVTCPAGNTLSRSKGIITFLEGVCDNTDDSSPCGGKVTLLAEVCFQPGRDLSLDGLLISNNAKGQRRTCFDEAAASDCTDPLPEGAVVIRESAVEQQSRWVYMPQLQSPSGAVQRSPFQVDGKIVPAATAPFTIDGRSVELPENVLTNSTLGQNDPDQDGCAAMNELLGTPPGCGFAGVMVAEPGPGCCGDCNGDGEVKIDELVTGVNNGLTGCPDR